MNTPRKEGPRKDFEEWGIDSATRPSSVIVCQIRCTPAVASDSTRRLSADVLYGACTAGDCVTGKSSSLSLPKAVTVHGLIGDALGPRDLCWLARAGSDSMAS